MAYDPEYTPARLTDVELAQAAQELEELTLEAKQIAFKAALLAAKIRGHLEAKGISDPSDTYSSVELTASESLDAAVEAFDAFPSQDELPTSYPPFS